MIVVLCEPDPRRLFEGVVRAARLPTPCAVLDPAWPQALRARCLAAVQTAGRTGDLGDDALVLFTSGSSGRPRAVARSRASWRASHDAFTRLTGLTCHDVVWLPGPLTSTLYLYGAVHADAVGAELVFGDDSPTRATVVHAVPALIPHLLAMFRSGEVPRLRLLVVAGDRLPERVRRNVTAAGLGVLEYYGAAELSFVGVRHDDAIMRPFPGVEVEVRDGVMWSRSPYAARGYLEGEGPWRRDDAGWMSVGDLAVAGPGDAFEVLGRGDCAVTVGGHTIVVEEVEAALRDVPGVDDAAVCGLPHDRLGQQLAAVVAGTADETALRRAMESLPRPARPRRFVRVARIPRTSSGKVRRADLIGIAGQRRCD